MPEIVIQGQSAAAGLPGYGRPGGLGVPPGGSVGSQPEPNYTAGVAPLGGGGDSWVAQTLARHAELAARGSYVAGLFPWNGGASFLRDVAPYGAGNMSRLRPWGGPSTVSPSAGMPDLAAALANAFGRPPTGGAAVGSVLYTLGRIREDEDAATRRTSPPWRESFRWAPPSATGIPSPPGGWGFSSFQGPVPTFLRRQRGGGGGEGTGGGGEGTGGGGEGTGGGGEGTGGGWGRGVPFAGLLGFGATSRLLTGGLTVGIAAAAAEELAFAPQTFGRLEGGALGAAAPYRNFLFSAYAGARAGGFSGAGLAEGLYQGIKPPEWMERLGLGPAEAERLRSGFGIVQGSNTANQALIQGLAGMQFTPALSGLNLEGSVSQAARYGLVSPNAGGVQQYTQQLAPILTMAVEQGFDRSAVARSIDAAVGSLGTSGGGGIGASPGSIGRFIMGYRDLPGGRTGEAGLSAMQQLQSATATVGQDPLRTLTFINTSQGLRTESQLKTFLDRNQPGYFDALKDNPVTSRMLQNYMAAQAAGDSYSAARWLAQIVGGGGTNGIPGNPEAEREIFSNNPFVRQLPAYMRPLATGGTGQQPGTFIAGQVDARRTLGDRSNNPHNIRTNGVENVYPNLATGLAASTRQIIRDVRVHGLRTLGSLIGDPTWGWAPASDGNDPVNYAKRVAARLGIGVNDPLDSQIGDPGFMSQLLQAMAPEEVGHGLPQESVEHGVSLGMGSAAAPAGYWADRRSGAQVGASPSLPGQNMPPPAALTALSDALAGTMKGSEISFAEMNVIIPAVNKGLAEFVKHLTDANRQMTIGRPSLGVPPYLMLPGN